MKFLIIVFIVFSNFAWGYNSSRCKRMIDSYGSLNPGRFMISSSSFITSTGDCAAIGMTSEERAQSFYAFNSDKVLEDLAKGNGEYLSSIEHLWGCTADIKKVRSQYRDILSLDIEKQYLEIRESCHK